MAGPPSPLKPERPIARHGGDYPGGESDFPDTVVQRFDDEDMPLAVRGDAAGVVQRGCRGLAAMRRTSTARNRGDQQVGPTPVVPAAKLLVPLYAAVTP